MSERFTPDGCRLRIEHDDFVGIGPSIVATAAVNCVADLLRVLFATVKYDMHATCVCLACCRNVDIACIREPDRPRVRTTDKFALVERLGRATQILAGWG